MVFYDIGYYKPFKPLKKLLLLIIYEMYVKKIASLRLLKSVANTLFPQKVQILRLSTKLKQIECMIYQFYRYLAIDMLVHRFPQYESRAERPQLPDRTGPLL